MLHLERSLALFSIGQLFHVFTPVPVLWPEKLRTAMIFKRGGNDYNPKGITLFCFVCKDNVVETFNSFDITRTTTQLFLTDIDE